MGGIGGSLFFGHVLILDRGNFFSLLIVIEVYFGALCLEFVES